MANIRVDKALHKQLSEYKGSMNDVIKKLLKGARSVRQYQKTLDFFHKERNEQVRKLKLRTKAIRSNIGSLLTDEMKDLFIDGIFKR